MKKERADKLIVMRGLAESRQKAQALIMAGLVFSQGQRLEKPGQLVPVDREISLLKTIPYVSRGGLKLEEALSVFQIPVCGKIAADLGSSTGGFLDCLLQKGIKKAYAVDVDTRQLDHRLREDPRVVLIEKNARYLKKEDFAEELDLVTMDVSFISVLKILPALKEVLTKGSLVSLLKPQFEVGRGQVGKKGIVKDPFLHQDVLRKISSEASRLGFRLHGLMKSSIRGQKGNQEFFAHWTSGEESLSHEEVENLIKEVVWNEKD